MRSRDVARTRVSAQQASAFDVRLDGGIDGEREGEGGSALRACDERLGAGEDAFEEGFDLQAEWLAGLDGELAE